MIISTSMERRHGVRIRTDCALTAHREGVSINGRAFDLSAGGALIRSAVRRPPPMVQRLEISLGSAGGLETLARTVWSRKEWHAVRFVGLSDVDRLEIAEHLDAVQRRRREAAKLAAAHFKAMNRDVPTHDELFLSERPTRPGTRFDPTVVDAFAAAVAAGDIMPPDIASQGKVAGSHQEVS